MGEMGWGRKINFRFNVEVARKEKILISVTKIKVTLFKNYY